MLLPVYMNGRNRNPSLRVEVRVCGSQKLVDYETVRKSNDSAERAAGRVLARMRKEKIL